MQLISAFYFDGEENGVLDIQGTSTTVFQTNPIAQRRTLNCYVSGKIMNLSPTTIYLKIDVEGEFAPPAIRLDGFDVLELVNMPFDTIRIALNGSARLKAQGFIVIADDPLEENKYIMNDTAYRIIHEEGRSMVYDQYDHTDINSATTTTVATPATNRIIRAYKVTLSVQGANRITLEWTDSDGTSNPRLIGIINFTAEGSFVYDFGDRGISHPRGAGGLLRVITTTTAVTDIDVISCDD